MAEVLDNYKKQQLDRVEFESNHQMSSKLCKAAGCLTKWIIILCGDPMALTTSVEEASWNYIPVKI